MRSTNVRHRYFYARDLSGYAEFGGHQAMKMSLWKVGLCMAALQTSGSLHAESIRDRSFDADWKFLRGDAPGADQPGFDDSLWRKLDLPHDWSIEDLPSKQPAGPELEAVTGEWRFQPGDNPGWKEPELDDRAWQKVKLPDTWEHHSGYTRDHVYGWFRRLLAVPGEWKGTDFELLMGRIDDVDEVWLNGTRIGGTGSFPPNYRSAWDAARRYRVPAALVHGDGTDVLAVRVYDGENNGGIYAGGVKTSRIGPFDPGESAGGNATGYTVGGVGWYRKHFALDEPDKRVAVRFDGVYMNAEFWINGHLLGDHPHGYTSFEFDLTPYVKPEGNVLAVCVRNTGKNSRWYSGSGIYRHAWLTVTEPVHTPTWGVFITTPEVSRDRALVKIAAEVSNAGDSAVDARVRARVLDPAGQEVRAVEGELRLSAHETRSIEQTVEVRSPGLWSPEAPNLYSAEVKVVTAAKAVEAVSTRFGIRKIEVDAEHGFRLNGEMLKLRGACVHHDNGPLGAAAIDRAEERKVELMKANGFNALRTSHNPPSPAFLEACDRLGMLVIDEAFDQWNEAKIGNEQDYHLYFKDWCERDVASMVRRDRNHPSIVMWSIGNEIPEQFRAEATAKQLRETVLAHDPTRLITQAICTDWGKVVRSWDQLSGPAFVALDVAGYNYLPEKYEPDHARHPDRVMMATESYPKDFFEYWSLVEKHPYVIGDFGWTGMDYFGEAGIAHRVLSHEKNSFFMTWPWFNAWCGDLDVCGFKKPQSFYRDVVWRRSQIEMAVHAPIPTGESEIVSSWGWPDETQSWNWSAHEGQPMQVSVYSRCEQVRLELNGEVVGEKPVSAATRLLARFEVPYAAGELRASGLIDGNIVAQTVLRTTGAPMKLRLSADRTSIHADRRDLAYVTVEIVDAHGQRVPDAKIPVRFAVSGDGELAAQGSGSPDEPASFQAPSGKTFQGRCLAILRPKGGAGEMTLRVEAAGFAPQTITVQTR